MIIGIVAEFNPLHSGHSYLIEEAKKLIKKNNGDGKIICVMSEFFTERGEVAIVNGHLRASEAIKKGIDLVLALPYKVSVSYSDDFAKESIKILKKCGCTHLIFGTEQSIYNFDNLYLKENEENYKENVKKLLKKGLSYSKIQSELLGLSKNSSNYILAYSYFKAVKKYAKNIKLVPILRTGQTLNEENIYKTNHLSATSIRKNINDEKIKKYISKNMYEILVNNKNVFIEDFYPLIKYKINSLGIKNIKKIYDVFEGLENRIYKENLEAKNYEELVKNISSKRYSEKKIQRILLHILTNTTNLEYKGDKTKNIRILAVKKSSTKLIKEINNNKYSIKLHQKLNKKNSVYFTHDIKVSRIYKQISKEKDIFKYNVEIIN